MITKDTQPVYRCPECGKVDCFPPEATKKTIEDQAFPCSHCGEVLVARAGQVINMMRELLGEHRIDPAEISLFALEM